MLRPSSTPRPFVNFVPVPPSTIRVYYSGLGRFQVEALLSGTEGPTDKVLIRCLLEALKSLSPDATQITLEYLDKTPRVVPQPNEGTPNR